MALGSLAGPIGTASADCSTLANCVIQDVQNAPAEAQSEAACIAAQLTSPDPSASDPLGTGVCGDVGTGLGAAQSTAAKGQQEAACVQGQVTRPNSNASDPLGTPVCGDVGSGVNAANGAVATAQSTATKGQQEAACFQGQVTSPDPGASDPLGTPVCGDVGTAVETATPVLQQVQLLLTQAEAKATKKSLICVLQGRYYAYPQQNLTGTDDCFVYEGQSPTDVSHEGHQSGRFSFPGSWCGEGPLPFCASPMSGDISAGAATYQVNMSLTGDSWFAYAGNWTDTDNSSHPASALLSVVPAYPIDPNGGQDQFVNGVVVMTP